MSDILNTLLARNESYLAHHQPLPPLPTMNTIIICCLDARIDPAHILGLKLGEALVVRNPGGRVTKSVEQEIGVVIAMVSKLTGQEVRPHVVLVQHTDCGMEKLAEKELAEKVSQNAHVSLDIINGLSVQDHQETLRADLDHLRNSEHLPSGILVSGLVYNERSGHAKSIFVEEST